jgi:hypothetical protein
MSDVDWLALWSEFAQAIDNEQLEVAERIIYLDGRWNFTELSSSKLIAAARQIIRERDEGRLSAAKITWREAVLCHGRLGPAAKLVAHEQCRNNAGERRRAENPI